ncbi:flagellar hook-associated protein FlgL [Liquorilactobacillus sicerae]|uniref:flagellar hook-associated protein FlgL n=1 Tax=Liquorilactobacillus sicerae TaxID=1416943 RepID=UPI00247FE788|nr:flagellar hook-associated protein FlgL [Liquorilactobacillus sicerae]
MRVADSTVYNSFISGYEVTDSKLQNTMEQLSSGKKVNSASDDPAATSKIISLNTAISQNDMYSTTISDSISWDESQDSALSSISDVMLNIRTLVEEAANSTNNSTDYSAIKDEVEQDIKQVVSTLNTKYSGSYIFGGGDNSTEPFELETDSDGNITGLTYNGDSKNLTREISSGTTVSLFADGSEFLTADSSSSSDSSSTDSTSSTLGSYFSDLISALNSGDTSSLSGDLLTETDDYRNNFVNIRASIGSLTDRLETASDLNSTRETNLKSDLSDVQDVDVAEAYTQFSEEKVAYQAVLAMGTKILDTSILDYID